MERVASGTPVNKTAAMVTGKGTSFEPEMDLSSVTRWDHRPHTYAVPKGTPDMTGKRQGRLTVVGYHGSSKNNRSSPSRWVVRCVCGMYEIRAGKSLRNANNSDDRCYDCRKLQSMQRNEEYRRLGYNREEYNRE